MKLLRKWKAKRAGVPFSMERFWPIGTRMTKTSPDGLTLIWQQSEVFEPPLIFGPPKPKRGDVVPVWFSNGMAHFYRVLSVGRLGGDDHIYDPTTYKLEFERSEPAELSTQAAA